MPKINQFNRDTIPDLLYQRAKHSAQDIAYRFPELQQIYSWSKVWSEIQQLAKGFLQLGVKKGDRVALLMEGRIELILSMYAAACVGAVAVPLNTYTKKNELKTYLNDSRPVMMIIGTKGQHLHYPTILSEIISDHNAKDSDSQWIPSNIFVLDEQSRISTPFRTISELIQYGRKKTEHDFIIACQLNQAKDPFLLLYTSGTTGHPKGVLRSTASFLFSNNDKKEHGKLTMFMMRICDKITRHFSLMNLMPLYHLGGVSTLFSSLKSCNIQITMISHYNPVTALAVIAKEKCSILVGTPFMILQMLTSPSRAQHDLSSLFGLACGAAPVNRNFVEKVTRELHLLFLVTGYGSTEAGPVANGTYFFGSKNNLLLSLLFNIFKSTNVLSGLIYQKDIEKSEYSIAGKVDRDVEVQILDKNTGEVLLVNKHGEIAIRSYRVMRYAKNNKDMNRFTEDGWYKSGDLGFLDEKGQLIIVGRLNRIISRGGEKVSPVEIENVLLKHKDIDDAIVVGIPDELYGEQICACIITERDSNLTAEKLSSNLIPHLSAFKIPKYFVFLNEFPIFSTGKVAISEIQTIALDQIGVQKEYA